MLRRQLAQVQAANEERIRAQKEAAAAQVQHQQMVMMRSEDSGRRNWQEELDRLDDDEIVQWIIEEKPPNSVVQKALKQFATSLEMSD